MRHDARCRRPSHAIVIVDGDCLLIDVDDGDGASEDRITQSKLKFDQLDLLDRSKQWPLLSSPRRH